jgi:hypothetical protein
MFQVKIGIRNMVMPGARSVRIVVIMFTAPRISAQTGDQQADDPHVGAGPGELCALLSGA